MEKDVSLFPSCEKLKKERTIKEERKNILKFEIS